ncbi:MAG: acetyl-CoA carboxylase biotin carboxyl carrier protein subunit [Flavobacteriales bacterium]|nr:acetyl-CoA carboxylase biotin carboxyl carrier protein subunit [Flavobacteriales bacterium]
MHTLGLDKALKKVVDLKAPMPGLVLNILVKPGDTVRKNDPVLVLEAMKMENVIKAPADAVVKAIAAEKGKPVEKGQLLISFN